MRILISFLYNGNIYRELVVRVEQLIEVGIWFNSNSSSMSLSVGTTSTHTRAKVPAIQEYYRYDPARKLQDIRSMKRPETPVKH